MQPQQPDLTVTWHTLSDNIDGFVSQDPIHFRVKSNWSGVYVIGRLDNNKVAIQAIDVGSGKIRDRLYDHLESIVDQYPSDNLTATCAEVPDRHQEGVERFLANVLESEFSNSMYPSATPISVNLPIGWWSLP